jgi:hypothetical protein
MPRSLVTERGWSYRENSALTGDLHAFERLQQAHACILNSEGLTRSTLAARFSSLRRHQVRDSVRGTRQASGAVIGVMTAYVLAHNERFLIEPANPVWQHDANIAWWLLPHGVAGSPRRRRAPDVDDGDRLPVRLPAAHRAASSMDDAQLRGQLSRHPRDALRASAAAPGPPRRAWTGSGRAVAAALTWMRGVRDGENVRRRAKCR